MKITGGVGGGLNIAELTLGGGLSIAELTGGAGGENINISSTSSKNH